MATNFDEHFLGSGTNSVNGFGQVVYFSGRPYPTRSVMPTRLGT
jgi:hypothetical protein